MTIDATVNDPRLVARIVNLAERCGCRYRSIAAESNDDLATRLHFEFAGEAEALRRLEAQIAKLVAIDRVA
jgi:acetolactate synthase regulatory subunit